MCVSELKSYLGMLMYYNWFLPNVSTVLNLLHELLRMGVEWEGTAERDGAFKTTKEKLKAAPVLTHYAHSKWMDIYVMSSITTEATMDNGPSFKGKASVSLCR